MNLSRQPRLSRFTSLVGFFLIELDFFYGLFFSHIVKNKIVLEKSQVIKLYKVTKIKGCEETIVHPHTLHYE
jgi:hypothetical protein